MRLNIEFLQTGGVPLTNDLMATIQDAYSIFNVIGDLAGHLTILAGCEPLGSSSVKPGIVAINGDVLFFEGGLISPTVFVQTENITKTFQDQIDKVLIIKKTVKFGNGNPSFNWADFTKLETLKEMQVKINNTATQVDVTALVARINILEIKTAPIINGGVIWAFGRPANEIPAGWKECIDTRGKTLVGRDPNDSTFSTLGNNIGTKTHQLSINEMPSHDHSSVDIANNSAGGSPGPAGGYDGGDNRFHQINRNTGAKGGDQPHNNIQPSRIVNFIEPNFQ